MSAVAPAPSVPPPGSSITSSAMHKQPRTLSPTTSRTTTTTTQKNSKYAGPPTAKSTSSSVTDEKEGVGNTENELQSIAALLSAASFTSVTMTQYIPTSLVGAVIGRRGQNMAQLQKCAAAAAAVPHVPVRVSVVGQQQQQQSSHDGDTNGPPQPQQPPVITYTELDWSDPSWTPVVIRADPCAAFTAAARIHDHISPPQQQHVILDVPLPRNRHATVIGKRGWTVATLSADHNVRIMVPSKHQRQDVIQLEGELVNVKACFHAILRVVTSAPTTPASTQGQRGTGNNKTTVEEPATLIVTQLPSNTKLRHVSRKTDTVIRKKKLDDTTWQLTVTGSGQIQAAVALLQQSKGGKEDSPDTSTSPTAGPTSPPSRPQQRGGAKGGRGNKGASSKRKPATKDAPREIVKETPLS